MHFIMSSRLVTSTLLYGKPYSIWSHVWGCHEIFFIFVCWCLLLGLLFCYLFYMCILLVYQSHSWPEVVVVFSPPIHVSNLLLLGLCKTMYAVCWHYSRDYDVFVLKKHSFWTLDRSCFWMPTFEVSIVFQGCFYIKTFLTFDSPRSSALRRC